MPAFYMESCSKKDEFPAVREVVFRKAAKLGRGMGVCFPDVPP